ncbi:MAG TPA: bifunctional (p)ppGpp synthetase/guanosine-3',5'-bis(diphosphate) 3'-pyrophosphohydrolase [Firmicutes bacterium]|nr:bifunctional (p)ppGpp synthetase/guanosine-3',5'-bis(diphosphate) 3'-pyrophosphohydrolase [Bacillota bacterium]
MAEAGIEHDPEVIRRVYAYAEAVHAGQKRDSGEDYIQHPLNVAAILVDMDMDATSIQAALLHDVVEDTGVTIDEIGELFGDKVKELVDGVTKLSRLSFQSKQEQQMENLRKMFLAMAHDLRVILIKLADRLHNMRTLKHLQEDKQRAIAKETLDIYAPLTHRLGMWKIKWEFEDLSLRYLEPQVYYELVDKVAMKRQERESYIREVSDILRNKLKELGIKAELQGRAKHFYSIYQKMLNQGKAFEEIYDLMALRVIVETIQDCYEVLGVVHTLWKPMPGRFKDYIAVPKSNMYQSLHTTVIGTNGEPLEIQIRTHEMHRTAEYGIAAHWQYKEKGPDDEELRGKIAWLRHLLEWQRDVKDADEFMENLKVGLFEDEVFVFTPRGDVKNLPAGSTPVDFAYSIHTHIGHQCVGAKVNGRLVPLDFPLKNGDIIQIITSKQGNGPSRDWLKFVKTTKAKNRIRQWLREQRREEFILLAKELLEKELRKQNLEVHENLKPDVLNDVAKRLGMVSMDDLLAAVGDGKITPGTVVSKIVGEKEPERKKAQTSVEKNLPRRAKHGVRVRGVEDLLVRFSRCCNPVPGDAIVGYITRGKGVAIHRVDCANIPMDSDARLIEVSWGDTEGDFYTVEIEIVADDRVNLLTDIMNAIAGLKLYISAARANTKKGQATISLRMEIGHLEVVQEAIRRIRKVAGVTRVYRASRGGRS